MGRNISWLTTLPAGWCTCGSTLVHLHVLTFRAVAPVAWPSATIDSKNRGRWTSRQSSPGATVASTGSSLAVSDATVPGHTAQFEAHQVLASKVSGRLQSKPGNA